MKYIFILFTFLFCANLSAASKIEFEHITFEEALTKAEQEGKLVFMDAYASWCGPCKRMASTVFTDESVAAFFNENFINLKIDMEKGEGPALARKYSVRAFPTLFIIDSDGKPVETNIGGMQAAQFLNWGKRTVENHFDISKIEAKYNEGEPDASLLYKYASGLKKKGQPYLKIANEYFRTENVEYDGNYIKALYDLTPHFDSKTFTHFEENMEVLLSTYAKPQVDRKIRRLSEATLQRAIEFKQLDILELAISKNKYYLENDGFEEEAIMAYYSEAEPNSSKYLKAAAAYLNTNQDNEDYFSVISGVTEYFPSKKEANKMIPYVEQLLKGGEKSKYYLAAAKIYKLTGKHSEAKEIAERGFEIAKRDKNPTREFREFFK